MYMRTCVKYWKCIKRISYNLKINAINVATQNYENQLRYFVQRLFMFLVFTYLFWWVVVWHMVFVKNSKTIHQNMNLKKQITKQKKYESKLLTSHWKWWETNDSNATRWANMKFNCNNQRYRYHQTSHGEFGTFPIRITHGHVRFSKRT